MSDQRAACTGRVCVFIDNTNLFHTVKLLAEKGQRIDYYFLKQHLADGNPCDVRFYYTQTSKGPALFRQVEKQKKFLSSIQELGYTMIGVESTVEDGVTKDGLELEVIYDMAALSRERDYNSFILVANDDIYAPVVKRLRLDTGMQVDVAFFGLPQCCTLLARAASHYHDLFKVSDHLFRRRKAVTYAR
jgi:hypothetical protein